MTHTSGTDIIGLWKKLHTHMNPLFKIPLSCILPVKGIQRMLYLKTFMNMALMCVFVIRITVDISWWNTCVFLAAQSVGNLLFGCLNHGFFVIDDTVQLIEL